MAKKKGKVESEEERLERLRIEELNAKEKERNEAEIRRTQMKLYQKREERYSHINNIKINNQWRQILRIKKSEELKLDIEIIAQNHESVINRKNELIQMLYNDMDESEREHKRAWRGHGDIIEKLFQIQQSRLSSLTSYYNFEVKKLEDKFKCQEIELRKGHDDQMKDLEDVIMKCEMEFKEAESKDLQDFESQREEIKNKDSEEYNVLKIQLEANKEDLEDHCQKAYDTYIDMTEHRTEAFDKLMKNDKIAFSTIEMRTKKLNKLQETLNYWRIKINNIIKIWDEKNNYLRNEKEIMKKHYKVLKSKMDNFRQIQSEHLKHLSICSNKSLDILEEKLETGESVLRLSEMCRKLETEEEQILAFCPEVIDHIIEENHYLTNIKEVANELREHRVTYDDYGEGFPYVNSNFFSMGITDGQEIEEYNYLDKFFKKYNKVYMEKINVEKEKERIKKENRELKEILKEYLNGISIKSNVVNDPMNTLLIINERLQTGIEEKKKQN